MAVATIATLVDTLRQNRLLEPVPLHELTAQGLQARFTDPEQLAQEMVRRQWLTPYQVQELLAGRARELVLGSYVIQDKLDEGPLGCTYRARHVHMRRVVTLNVIREDLLAEPTAVERFYRELQAASQLSSPHIVHAYDAGPYGRTHFFAQEYVQGTDLGKLVAESGPLPAERACSYIYQAALGLQDAHEKRFLHGDLKPANLVVVRGDTLDVPTAAPGGLVKICSLGLTFLQTAAHDGTGPLFAADTLDFLAPERGDGASLGDVRSDLYSLGCIFYFLLTGQVPHPGGSPEDKPRRHREEEPVPLDLLVTDVPPTVQDILQQAIAKNPAERFHTPAELVNALAPVLGLEVVPPRPLSQPPRPELAPSLPVAPAETLEDLTATIPIRVQRRKRSRGLFWLNVGSIAAAVVIMGTLIALFWNPMSPRPGATGPVDASGEGRAQAEYQVLAARAEQSPTDLAKLREDLEAFRVEHPGTELTVQAAALLSRLPSPWDQLDARAIRPEQVSAGMPAEVVAVLGEARQRHWGTVASLAFQADGKRLVSGGSDGTIRIWDAETMNELAVLTGHAGEVSGLAFSADGPQLISAATDTTVRLWDLDAAPPVVKTLLRPVQAQYAMALSPNGQTLAVAGQDKIIRLWTLPATDKDKPLTLTGHSAEVRGLAFSPDGKTLASASTDKTVRLWDLSKAIPVEQAVLQGHTLPVLAVAFSADGQVLASGGNDKTVRLWNVATGKPHQPEQLTGHTAEVHAVAFHRDGSRVATGSRDGSLRLWNWSQGQPVGDPAQLRGHRDAVRALAFAADRPLLASGGNDQTVRLWELTPTGAKPRGRIQDWPPLARAVAVSPDNHALVVAGSDNNLRLWELDAGKLVERLAVPAPGPPINDLAFDPAGVLLASAHQDFKVRLWRHSPRRLEEPQALEGHASIVAQVVFSPDGKELASVSSDRTAILWGLADASMRPRFLRGAARELRAAAFSADSKMLAVTGADGFVQLWRLTFVEPKVTASWKIAPGTIQCLDFAPQGNLLATSGQDGKIRLWEIGEGQPANPRLLDGHKTPVLVVRFAADNRSLVSADSTGQIVWWELAAGTPKGKWQLPGGLQSIALCNDSRHLVTANNNGTFYIIRLAAPGTP